MSLARCSAGPSPRGVRVPFGLLPRRAAALAVTGVPLAAPGLFVVACVLDISALTTGPGGCGASSPRAASRCAAGAHAQVRSFQLCLSFVRGNFSPPGVSSQARRLFTPTGFFCPCLFQADARIDSHIP
jgi:hypothetical protein